MIETIKKSVEEINDDFDSFRIVLTSVITHDTHRKKCLKELGALRNATLTSHLSLIDTLVKELEGKNGEDCHCHKNYDRFIRNGLAAGFTDDQVNFMWEFLVLFDEHSQEKTLTERLLDQESVLLTLTVWNECRAALLAHLKTLQAEQK